MITYHDKYNYLIFNDSSVQIQYTEIEQMIIWGNWRKSKHEHWDSEQWPKFTQQIDLLGDVDDIVEDVDDVVEEMMMS